MELHLKVDIASDFGFRESLTIDSSELHETLIKLKDRHDCGRFVIHYDYMYDDETEQVSVTVYDSYIE